MKPFLKLLYATGLLTFMSAPAQAQALTPQVKKSIDAQAVAFTGQHCTGKYSSKPARTLPAGRFQFVTRLMDATFTQLKTEHPEITLRSDNNGKDLYRVLIGKPGNMGFVVGYLQQGKFYIYGCEVR